MIQEQVLVKDVVFVKIGYSNGVGNSNSCVIIFFSGIYEIFKVLVELLRLELMLVNVINILFLFLKMCWGVIIVFDGEGLLEIIVIVGFMVVREGILFILQKVIDQIVVISMLLVIQDVVVLGLFEVEVNDGVFIVFIGVFVKVDYKVFGILFIDWWCDGGMEFCYDEDM